MTGYGRASSSGAFSLRTANSGANGVSGFLSFRSGTASKGSSGGIVLKSGAATSGAAGRTAFSFAKTEEGGLEGGLSETEGGGATLTVGAFFGRV